MKFILGTKEYMTQIFDEEGRVHAGTLITAGPVTVVQIKTPEKDGYSAVQVGFGVRKKKRTAKAQSGHTKEAREKSGSENDFRVLKEFRISPEEAQKLAVGDVIDVSIFEEGEAIQVSGLSKGKGFQGVVKRHGFAGGPRTHGQKHSEREGGSIGATGPQRVMKGVRMPGRMGGKRRTVKGLEIVKKDAEGSFLFISGSIPGRRGSVLEITSMK